ncbi:MAG TPA: four-helix bundle copper-binding protein [Myxococcaceae bacterium]|nr:four-helix bundle copper-binding protein [Myxococcaceae bacterium]
MQRREFLFATAGLAGAVRAAPDAGSAPTKGPGLVQLASDCIELGEECQAHCLQQFAAGDTSLAGCARSVTMMIAMCRALVTASAQSSPRLKEIARVCGQVCRDCETACKPHAGHHDICRRCMESCKACAAACEKTAA